MLLIENRHHEFRVPVYASTYFSSKKAQYKESIRKIEDCSQKESTATIAGRNINYSWLQGAADTYKISPDIKDYILSEIPIVTVGYPNRNLHCFPYDEVTYFDPRFGQFVYKTFVGKCAFVDHCFAAGTMIRVEGGKSKPIEEIKVGDKVLTHEMRYRSVTEVFKNGVKPLKRVKVQGISEPLFVTENHPVYTVDWRQVFGEKDPKTNQTKREWRKQDANFKAHWRPISDVYPGDYLCIPIEYGGTESVDPNLAFIAGAYLADGYILKDNGDVNGSGVGFTIGIHEKEFATKIKNSLTALGYAPRIYDQASPGCLWIQVSNKELANTLKNLCGECSESKQLKEDIKHWDIESTKIMLGGYISGDGCFDRKKGSIRVRTSSKELLKDLQQAFAFIGIPACVGIDIRLENAKVSYIDGVEVKARHDSGYLRVNQHFTPKIQNYVVGKNIPEIASKADSGKGIIWGNYLLMPVLSIEDAHEEEVFNFEVEEDHTYIANNLVVHNCNKVHTEAKGTIFDATMKKVPGWDIWKINILIGYDKTKDAALARAIEKGQRRSYSMGAWVSYFINSITGQISNGSQALKYPKGTVHDGRLSYDNCSGVEYFECSSVEGPADVSAESHQLWYF